MNTKIAILACNKIEPPLAVIKQVLEQTDEFNVVVYLDKHGYNNAIVNLIGDRFRAQIDSGRIKVKQSPVHLAINLAPIESMIDMFEIEKVDCFLHLDDDLILSPTFIYSLFNAWKWARADFPRPMLLSSNLHKYTPTSSSDYQLTKGLPQWSNVIIDKEYYELFKSSGWLQLYILSLRSGDFTNFDYFLRAHLRHLQGWGKEYASNLPHTHYRQQDVFQNLFILINKLRTCTTDAPRCTLQRMTTSNVTIEYIDAHLCKPEDLIVDPVIPINFKYNPDYNVMQSHW